MPRSDSSENSDNVEYWTDDGYSTNNSNNPYQFNHLHEYWSSVEEDESVEDLDRTQWKTPTTQYTRMTTLMQICSQSA
jgi:hypothetical protein